MAWKPYIRCPCCGKLASAYAIGHAGTHLLGVRRILRSLGYRYGFEWSNEPLGADLAGALVRGLAKSLVQVLRLTPVPAHDLIRMALPDLETAVMLARDALRLQPERVPVAEPVRYRVGVTYEQVAAPEASRVEPTRERVAVGGVRARVV